MTKRKKMLGVFIAINGVGCAVSLFLQSGLGSDPIGLLSDGIRHTLNIQYGNASLLYNIVVIAIALLVARTHMGLGTIVYAVFAGYFIDFYNWIFEPLQMGDYNLYWRILIYITGQILLSAALAMLIYFKLGMNALDAIVYKVEEATRIPYSALRIGCDIIYTIIGTLLGGVFGVGTIISVLTTGLLISKFTKVMEIWGIGRKIQNNH